MKTLAIRALRQKLAADQPVFGLWVTLESPSVTEMAVALGLDWIVLDAEHGHLDWKHLVEHLRAAVRSSTVVLIRVAELNVALIKRALDIGADGVVIPWVETPEQARALIARAAREKRILQVGHLERFNAAVLAAEPHLNAPRFMECHRLAPYKERGTDVNVVLDLMIHDIDLVQSLAGSELVSIDAIGSPQRAGWYARVLVEGRVRPGDPITLLSRTSPEWTVERAARVRRDDADVDGARALVKVEGLSEKGRAKLSERFAPAGASS